MKINCNVAYVKNKLMIVMKKTATFNIISFTSDKFFISSNQY